MFRPSVLYHLSRDDGNAHLRELLVLSFKKWLPKAGCVPDTVQSTALWANSIGRTWTMSNCNFAISAVNEGNTVYGMSFKGQEVDLVTRMARDILP